MHACMHDDDDDDDDDDEHVVTATAVTIVKCMIDADTYGAHMQP